MYPRTGAEVLAYLKNNPIVHVKYPTKQSTYRFQSGDEFRVWFITPDGDQVMIAMQEFNSGKINYNADGFTRNLGAIVGWFYYTGPKPWQAVKPDWLRQAEEWDAVLEGLKQFVD